MSEKLNVADLRKSYEKAELSETASSADPSVLFDCWLKEAIQAELPEPTAMTLATVSKDNRPSTRPVLVKRYDERGLVWYSNYESRKGIELASNPWASLQFHWVELERVVRLEGRVEKISAQESDIYFHSRPFDHRIGAWASPQSQIITDRSVIEKAASKYLAEYPKDPPRPKYWGGYRLKPELWEFWQGRKSRLHDRLRYQLNGKIWERVRLAP